MNKALTESFARFYQFFPKKVSVGAAKKKWEQINPDESLVDRMIEAVKLQTKEYLKENGPQSGSKAYKYFQGPAPWLNSEAWENEVILKKVHKQKASMMCHCGQPATNQGKLGVWQCADHFDAGDPDRSDRLRNHFISLGIKQEGGKWKDSCIRYLKTCKRIGEI